MRLRVRNCLFGFRNKHAILVSPLHRSFTIFRRMSSAKEVDMSPRKSQTFDPKAFLAQTGLGRTIIQYPKNKLIFAQGEPSDSVFYIQTGRARLTVLSKQGKEATIALLR